ncbi:MAG: group III truncated hemoglobin [Bacteroidota bacterium]
MKKDICSKEDVKRLIDAFYEKLLSDEEMAHIFLKVAKIDLPEHLPFLYSFWNNLLFATGEYHRNAMVKHLALNDAYPLNEEHFRTWLGLFAQTVDELFEGEKATMAKERARSIGGIMQYKIHQTNPNPSSNRHDLQA